MKKLLFAIIAMMFLSAVSAQDSIVHMNFRGIPITGTIDSFSHELEKLGYKEITRETEKAYFEGMFTGEKVQLVISYTSISSTVWRVDVQFEKPTRWDELEGKYYKYKNMFISKYGKPQYSSENFHSSVVRGEELAAVFRGYRCFYNSKFYLGNGEIYIHIQETGLSIFYDDNNGVELAREEHKNAPKVNNDF